MSRLSVIMRQQRRGVEDAAARGPGASRGSGATARRGRAAGPINSPQTAPQATPATPQPSFSPSRIAKRDVGAVEHELQQQAEPPLAAPQHVAEDGIVDERERRAEQPHADIGVHGGEHARLGADEAAAGQRHQRRQRRQRHADRERRR